MESEARALLAGLRQQLARLYDSPGDEQTKQRAKGAALADARRSYLSLKQAQGWDNRLDGWFDDRLNNALLSALHTYHHWVPAFEALLIRCQGDLASFHSAVARLAALPAAQRRARLEALARPHD